MNRESVPHRMGCNGLADARDPPGLLARQFDGTSVDGLAGHITLEQATLRPHGPPVIPERLQQFGRQHYVTILLAFALLDTDDHALTIDIGGLQANGFGNA